VEANLKMDTASESFDAAGASARAIGNESSRSYQLQSVAMYRARAKQFKEAFDLARSIEDNRIRAQALAALVRNRDPPPAMVADQIEAALMAARSITEGYLRDSVLNDIAAAQAKAGYLDQALSTVLSIPRPSDRESALSSVAKALAQRGQIDEARAMAEKIVNEQYREFALAEIVGSLARSRNIKPAYELAQSIRRDYSKLTALLSLLEDPS
jgi:hypothetical protein